VSNVIFFSFFHLLGLDFFCGCRVPQFYHVQKLAACRMANLKLRTVLAVSEKVILNIPDLKENSCLS
jgi:hypothetical protein